jgi:hypothetical protein
MDTQQAILTDILFAFKKKGIEFAMPTQKVYSNDGRGEIIRDNEKDANRP